MFLTQTQVWLRLENIARQKLFTSMCQRNHFGKKLKQLEMSQQALPKQRKRENANCKKKSKKVIRINFCLV